VSVLGSLDPFLPILQVQNIVYPCVVFVRARNISGSLSPTVLWKFFTNDSCVGMGSGRSAISGTSLCHSSRYFAPIFSM
ncbi:hypothetical protein ACHAW6_013730, partial [Cyclotella cf. meneghiniana]